MQRPLGVLSVLMGIIALTMAFVVFRRNHSQGAGTENLARDVSGWESRLASLQERMDGIAKENATLNQRLTGVERKLDADPAALAAEMFNERLNERVRKAVEVELSARLKAAAGDTAARPQESERDVNFDTMVGGLAAVIGAEPGTALKLRALCEETRTKLNNIYADKKLNDEQKKQQMDQARVELMEKIRGIVGDENAPRLDQWKKSVAHNYSRRFFGLED